MGISLVDRVEEAIGSKLPADYAGFLATHSDSFLDEELSFKLPRLGVIDQLLTAEEIIENSKNDCLGIPSRGLVHIGSNLMGGYLYIKLEEIGLGEVHYSENGYFKEVFPTFSMFLEGVESA